MDNSSADNCTNVDETVKHYYLPVMYSIIFVVGLAGNLTSLVVYLFKVRPWKSCSIIMVNLAATDLLFVLSMPFLIYYYSSGDSWKLGDFMCRFVRFGYHFNLYGSILFLTCLAIFRYLVVLHPLKVIEYQRVRWGVLACLVIWALAAAEIGPMMTMITLVEQNNKTQCLDFASNDPAQVWWYSWILAVFGYFVPLVVVCVCYAFIARELNKGPHIQSPQRTRARRLTMVVIICFVVCFMPFHILRALRVDTRRRPDTPCMLLHGVNAAYVISRPLASFNSIFNLILYTLAGDHFQQALQSLVHGKRWRRMKAHMHIMVVNRPALNHT
ncbi:2-oxoglutarate receptor 1-like isoform X1 [Denticeps clupeoides]|uniref:2-oxoglutarate receptor 1-like isoform X1 n=1 Tax=Denticeps clupeoides TaxID=299321 RepID=UPI0010A4700F|nr:2-oxoglutarate receptor 1-like isoform X1 [Denticeps clupeoides]